MSLDRATLHRLQKPWLDVANITRYSPGVRPSIVDAEQPQDKRRGEIVQVRLPLLPLSCPTLILLLLHCSCT
jgi:hypothetical protein